MKMANMEILVPTTYVFQFSTMTEKHCQIIDFNEFIKRLCLLVKSPNYNLSAYFFSPNSYIVCIALEVIL